ncbi:MAG: hypothetical protein Q4D79_03100, partial [Propionibacteriaceae bacterium]|nr:hypothetical protein [Propionibacteriaceae bacterium]
IVDVTLKATAEAGKAIDAAQLPQGWVMNPDGTATFSAQVEQPKCDKPVAPVSPTLTPGACEPGATEATRPTVTAADTEGITYTSPAVNQVGDTTVYEIIMTARPAVGYVIDKDNLPEGWAMNADGVSANFTGTVTNPVCAKPVVPVSPTVTPGVCVAGSATATDPTVVVPETEGITYGAPEITVEGATATIKVTATRKDGFIINGDNLPDGWVLDPATGVATFTTTVEQPKCDKPVVPVDPTVAVGTCEPGAVEPTDPTITAADTEGIDYATSWAVDDDEVVFSATATAKVGYVIDKDNLTAGWTWNNDKGVAEYAKRVTNPVCAKPVVPVSPTVTPGVCVAGSATATDPTVVVPETEGITYGAPEITVEGATATIKVTATRKDGFIIDGGNLPQGWVYNNDGTATFTTTVEQPKCEAPAPPTPSTPADPVNPVDPKVTPGVCKPGSSVPTPPVVELPTAPGLVYGTPSMSVHGGKVKITVVVTPEAGKKIGDLGKGWTLNQDGTATFTYMVSNPICVKPGMPKTGI